MSYPEVFNWPAPDTQAISLTQSLSGAGNLLINGHLTINAAQPGNAIFPRMSRTVSLTSTNNLSGVNFTITGTYNSQIVSETRAGPNNNTVYTTQLFDSVTSVSANGAAAAVSIGTGTTGHTRWFNYDYNRHFSTLSIQAVVAGTIDYTFNVTLDDVQTNSSPAVFQPIMALTTATTNQFFSNLGLTAFNYANFTINSSGTDGALVGTIMQTGIN
jgi:hypothetical protein